MPAEYSAILVEDPESSRTLPQSSNGENGLESPKTPPRQPRKSLRRHFSRQRSAIEQERDDKRPATFVMDALWDLYDVRDEMRSNLLMGDGQENDGFFTNACDKFLFVNSDGRIVIAFPFIYRVWLPLMLLFLFCGPLIQLILAIKVLLLAFTQTEERKFGEKKVIYAQIGAGLISVFAVWYVTALVLPLVVCGGSYAKLHELDHDNAISKAELLYPYMMHALIAFCESGMLVELAIADKIAKFFHDEFVAQRYYGHQQSGDQDLAANRRISREDAHPLKGAFIFNKYSNYDLGVSNGAEEEGPGLLTPAQMLRAVLKRMNATFELSDVASYEHNGTVRQGEVFPKPFVLLPKRKEWNTEGFEDNAAVWTMRVTGARRVIFETRFSCHSKLLILFYAFSGALLPCVWMHYWHPSEYLMSAQGSGGSHTFDKLLMLMAVSNALLIFYGIVVVSIIVYSRMENLEHSLIKLLMLIYLSTTDLGRRRLYAQFQDQFNRVKVRTDAETPATELHKADPMLKAMNKHTLTWPKPEERAEENLAELVECFRHTKLKCEDPQGKHPDAMIRNLEDMQFKNLDTFMFLAIRLWMMVDVTAERSRIQNTLLWLAVVLLLAFAQLAYSFLLQERIILSTVNGFWLLLTAGGMFVFTFNKAVTMNIAMKDCTIDMLQSWEYRAQMKKVQSTYVEMTVEDMHKGKSSLFLNQNRIQVDNYLRTIVEKLEFLKNHVIEQEQPISFFALSITPALRQKLIVLVATAFASLLIEYVTVESREVLASLAQNETQQVI